jgi:hypothetical protein
MSLLHLAALAGVLGASTYLIMLGGLALSSSPSIASFLMGFASSPALHYLELAIRMLVGGSLVTYAPFTCHAWVFRGAGWIVIGTTVVLLCVPWQLHRRFAQWSVPQALQYRSLIGLCSVLGGLAALLSVACGAINSGT